uniref:Protein spinster homolog 1 (Trinotate prediction) n=1 Tax=Henneguya salminicola TaxID=69463 RepID=A0A6G3ML80_HENSL
MRKIITIIILCLINTMNYVDRYLVFGILPKIKDYFNLSNSQAGLLQTVFLITYIGCSFWFGAIGDKISRKYIIFGGTVLWSVFSFVGSLASRDVITLYKLSTIFGFMFAEVL